MQRLSILLPRLDKLHDQLVNHWPYYLGHWADTLAVSLSACALAIVLATALALGGLRYPVVHKIVSPLSALSQSFPLQAIGPVIIITLGAGFLTKCMIAFIITIFPIQGTMVVALDETPRQYLLFTDICRATFLQTVWSVRLPFALPRIVTALKVGFTMSVIGAVVAEFISPQGGIGEILLVAQSQFSIEPIYICLVMLMVQGLTIYLGLSSLEQRLLDRRRQIA